MAKHVFSLPPEDRKVLLKEISGILKGREEIRYAYVFGSFVHESFFRDVDLAVRTFPETLPEVSFAYEDALAQFIIEQTSIPYPVDVRLINQVPISFEYKVFQGILLVDRTPEARVARVEYIVSRYLDLKPVLLQATREIFANEP